MPSPIRRWRLTTVSGRRVTVVHSWLTYDGLMKWINDGNPRTGIRYNIEHWENGRWKYLTTYHRE